MIHRVRRRIALLGAGLCTVPSALLSQTKAHVHGQATLDIGIEGSAGTIEFRAPADDLYGFERAPKTAAERATRDAALARLRTGGATLVRFDASLGCTMTSSAVGATDEKSGHGDVRATYTLNCKKPLAGKPIAFGFSKAFPGVRSVKVQLLSDTAQVGLTVSNDQGVIRP